VQGYKPNWVVVACCIIIFESMYDIQFFMYSVFRARAAAFEQTNNIVLFFCGYQ
jgi:hypothetical protein